MKDENNSRPKSDPWRTSKQFLAHEEYLHTNCHLLRIYKELNHLALILLEFISSLVYGYQFLVEESYLCALFLMMVVRCKTEF